MSEITPDNVLAVLAQRIGANRGATAAELVAAITGTAAPDPVGERQLRQCITRLRERGHAVCAHPDTGYFIAETPDELDRTCEYLHARAMASLRQIARMKGISEPDLRGQLHLPT
jgi:hypothetical protein